MKVVQYGCRFKFAKLQFSKFISRFEVISIIARNCQKQGLGSCFINQRLIFLRQMDFV
jgi:hypothetical protein